MKKARDERKTVKQDNNTMDTGNWEVYNNH